MALDNVEVFSGQSHPEFAEQFCKKLGVPLQPIHFERFSNDNLYIQLGSSVRGKDVVLIQTLTPPVSDNLVSMLMMLDIARTGAARSVYLVMPYFSYARSDKKDAPRICVTARLVADAIEMAGATHVLTMTMHSPQVHGFFRIPTDHLTPRSIFAKHLEQYVEEESSIVVSPDIGHVKRASRLAMDLGVPIAAGNKRRLTDTSVSVDALIGSGLDEDIEHAIIYDDEIATGTSVIAVMDKLRERGFRRFSVCCVHGVFTSNALQKLDAMEDVVRIVTTDTIPQNPGESEKLQVLPVAQVFAEAVKRTMEQQSLKKLFAFWEDT
jgi:ribose-phosphate pyrophosphokinase